MIINSLNLKLTKKKLVRRSQSDLRAATEKLHSQTQNQAFQTNTDSGQKISIFNLWFRVLAFDLTKTLREREKKKTKNQCFNGITKRRRWRRRMHVDCRRISASPEKDSIHGIAQKCQHRSQTCKCCASWLHFRIHQKVLDYTAYMDDAIELIRYCAAHRTCHGSMHSTRSNNVNENFRRRCQRNRATQIKTCEQNGRDTRTKKLAYFFPCQKGIKKLANAGKAEKQQNRSRRNAQSAHTHTHTARYSAKYKRIAQIPCINAKSRDKIAFNL